jgi:hypothetical protein
MMVAIRKTALEGSARRRIALTDTADAWPPAAGSGVGILWVSGGDARQHSLGPLLPQPWRVVFLMGARLRFA